MKKVLFCLLLSGLTLCLHAQKKPGEAPFMTKSFANESIKNVDVKTSGGSISVTGAAASEARVEVFIHGNNSSDNSSAEEIKRRLEENYDLNVSLSSGTITANAKPKDRNMNWKKGLSISFKVYAPKNINTDLATSGGSISIANLAGSQEFSTSGGSLHVDKLSGKVKGSTSGGSIHVSNSTDDINLSTSGGSIHADNCNGNLNLTTSGGSLDLSDLKGKIEANTSGGSINGSNIEGELSTGTSGGTIRLSDLSCSLETYTSGGSIDVSMKQLGKYIKISNSAGNIDLEIPADKGVNLNLSGRKVSFSSSNNFSGKMDDDEVDGKLNGGGIPVTVKAGSGKVSLTVR